MILSHLKFFSSQVAEYPLCSILFRLSLSLLKWSCPFSRTPFHKLISMAITYSQIFTQWDLLPLFKMAIHIFYLPGQTTDDLRSIFLHKLRMQKWIALLWNFWPMAQCILVDMLNKHSSFLWIIFSCFGVSFSHCAMASFLIMLLESLFMKIKLALWKFQRLAKIPMSKFKLLLFTSEVK